jgi:photosystem II oxygen-evolving enhancer protein 1
MKQRALISIFLAICFGLMTACSSGPRVNNGSLSYDDIRGSGLANNCPELSANSFGTIAMEANQNYQLRALCLQPQAFMVKRSPLMKRQEETFENTKLLTRASYTLDQVSGSLKVGADGKITFVEQGGFDFQPVTVQLSDGERVPLLFTVKGMVAQSPEASGRLGPASRLEGVFQVPPYRTSSFVDPKGRGLAVGYDAAVGLPIKADSEDFVRQNIKSFEVGEGRVVLQINQVNQATGEIAGLFESIQPSDTEFGVKQPLDVKIKGRFYGRIEPEII